MRQTTDSSGLEESQGSQDMCPFREFRAAGWLSAEMKGISFWIDSKQWAWGFTSLSGRSGGRSARWIHFRQSHWPERQYGSKAMSMERQ